MASIKTHGVHAVGRRCLRAGLDLRIDGASNIPPDGPVVLAANHLSFLDSPLLMLAFDRMATMIGKAEYLDSWKTRGMVKAAGMIAVDRAGSGIGATMREAKAVLRSGGVLGLFPEGTRSRDGDVGAGHRGAVYLAQATGAALIPIGIRGTDMAQPIGSVRPRWGSQVEMAVGAPVDLAGCRTAVAQRGATADLMQTIAGLAQLDYAGPCPSRPRLRREAPRSRPPDTRARAGAVARGSGAQGGPAGGAMSGLSLASVGGVR